MRVPRMALTPLRRYAHSMGTVNLDRSMFASQTPGVALVEQGELTVRLLLAAHMTPTPPHTHVYTHTHPLPLGRLTRRLVCF